MRIASCLLACLIMCSGQAAAGAGPIPITKEPASQWIAKGELAIPAVPTGIPAVSAGCLTIGHHVLADGSVAKPRVLRGAFTANIDDAQRGIYTAAALESAASWRFTPTATNKKSNPSFTRETIGFVPDAAIGQMRKLSNADGMPKNLSEQCEVADLAAWGEANAVTVEHARAQSGDKIIVRKPGDPSSFWVAKDMTPPRYSYEAVRAGVQACIIVGFIIQADGQPTGFRIMSSALDGPAPRPLRTLLEDSSVVAASKWRFAPGPDNLGRIPQFEQVPVTFSLNNSRWKPDACQSVDVSAAIESIDTKPDTGTNP